MLSGRLPLGGLLKGPSGAPQVIPDGPGALRGFAPPPQPRGSPWLPSPPRGPLLAAAGGSGGGGRRHEAGSPRSRAGRRGIPAERAREVRARVGRGGRRAEGGEPSGAGRRGGRTARRPRPRLAEPVLRRLRTRSLCLLPLDGGGAVTEAVATGSAGDGEPYRTRASSRRPRPSGWGGGAAPPFERTPWPRRGHPRALTASFRASGRAALAPEGTPRPPAGAAAPRERS